MAYVSPPFVSRRIQSLLPPARGRVGSGSDEYIPNTAIQFRPPRPPRYDRGIVERRNKSSDWSPRRPRPSWHQFAIELGLFPLGGIVWLAVGMTHLLDWDPQRFWIVWLCLVSAICAWGTGTIWLLLLIGRRFMSRSAARRFYWGSAAVLFVAAITYRICSS